jgi:hypothetical protein
VNIRSDQDFLLAVIAIVTIFILELVALSKGVNGLALTTSLAGIAGAAGVSIGRYVQKVKAEIKAVEKVGSQVTEKVDHAR